MKPLRHIILYSAIALGLNACSSEVNNVATSQTANQIFDDMYMEHVMRSPNFQSFLGIKDDQDKWSDIDEAEAQASLALTKQQLAKVKSSIRPEHLDEQTALSYRLFLERWQDDIDNDKWRKHSYPITQMGGTHTSVATMLINQHPIKTLDDAQDYIARLNGIPKLFGQLTVNLRERADMGVLAPKFIWPQLIEASQNIITGAPFNEGEDSTLWADFGNKIAKTDFSDSDKQKLLSEAKAALIASVQPAYLDLISTLEELALRATDDDGAWKLPDGDAYYQRRLETITTTKLTAEQIHQIGLDEVARIHDEMRSIMSKVEFQGTLQEFFVFMREAPQFYYDNNDAGRQRYLDEATAIIDNMKGRLDEIFITKPKADLIVKAVEPFREKSAGKAFYQRPAPDGSRPGMYYANLYEMASMPTYQMEALAYHEGIPGHHMQLAISQELEGLPKFRRFGSATAYTEGWGLYTEYLPKEMGMYSDPYSDFGRLAMELWRACRLVVDTGIHHSRWTRQQAIDYLTENTPNSHEDIEKAIGRYIAWPGQATAYKIGMLKILELREMARAKLGEKFDIRAYHDVILRSGPLPLDMLEEEVNKWVSNQQI
jgi:uncharacterized protein (DUF885 family)